VIDDLRTYRAGTQVRRAPLTARIARKRDDARQTSVVAGVSV
jgi:hypothetical protein